MPRSEAKVIVPKQYVMITKQQVMVPKQNVMIPEQCVGQLRVILRRSNSYIYVIVIQCMNFDLFIAAVSQWRLPRVRPSAAPMARAMRTIRGNGMPKTEAGIQTRTFGSPLAPVVPHCSPLVPHRSPTPTPLFPHRPVQCTRSDEPSATPIRGFLFS